MPALPRGSRAGPTGYPQLTDSWGTPAAWSGGPVGSSIWRHTAQPLGMSACAPQLRGSSSNPSAEPAQRARGERARRPGGCGLTERGSRCTCRRRCRAARRARARPAQPRRAARCPPHRRPAPRRWRPRLRLPPRPRAASAAAGAAGPPRRRGRPGLPAQPHLLQAAAQGSWHGTWQTTGQQGLKHCNYSQGSQQYQSDGAGSCEPHMRMCAMVGCHGWQHQPVRSLDAGRTVVGGGRGRPASRAVRTMHERRGRVVCISGLRQRARSNRQRHAMTTKEGSGLNPQHCWQHGGYRSAESNMRVTARAWLGMEGAVCAPAAGGQDAQQARPRAGRAAPQARPGTSAARQTTGQRRRHGAAACSSARGGPRARLVQQRRCEPADEQRANRGADDDAEDGGDQRVLREAPVARRLGRGRPRVRRAHRVHRRRRQRGLHRRLRGAAARSPAGRTAGRPAGANKRQAARGLSVVRGTGSIQGARTARRRPRGGPGAAPGRAARRAQPPRPQAGRPLAGRQARARARLGRPGDGEEELLPQREPARHHRERDRHAHSQACAQAPRARRRRRQPHSWRTALVCRPSAPSLRPTWHRRQACNPAPRRANAG